MKSCVFDIETAPLPDRQIPPALVAKLKDVDDPESWREKLGLYAPAASVIVIAMLDPETGQGEVLYDDRHGTVSNVRVPEGITVALSGGAEPKLLEHFWRAASTFDRIVTYNGRRFDVPFLMQRSLIRGVPITRDLLGPRQPEHHDLAEILALRRATRMYGLATWAQAVGAEDPKAGGITGATVHEAFAMGKTREIAEYCIRDVQATNVLAERVLRLWKPLVDR